MQAVIDKAMGPKPYNLAGRNCAAFVAEVLRAGGLQVPGTIYPRELMRSASGMKAIVVGFSIAGALVPIFMLGVSSLQGGVFQWPKLGVVLWPSWIILMATSGREGASSTYAILAISIVLNIVLYSVVGALIGALINVVKAASITGE